MIYLDHAATSFPKPLSVVRESLEALTSPLGNPGRSGHVLSRKSSEIVYRARESVAALVGAENAEQIVFCSGATAALNFAILGICKALQRSGRIPIAVSSILEHNSVLRPLFSLEKEGRLRLFLLAPKEDGNLSEEALFSLRPDLLVLTCRSNVTGHCFQLNNAINRLKKEGTIVIMDAAQSLGSGTCTLESTGAHILCAPGHKGLMGLMGGGFLACARSLPLLPEPILTGGSGSDSFRETMPELLPERLEAGTLPLAAIASMGAGARYLMQVGTESVGAWERECKKQLLKGLSALPRYRLYEPWYPDGPLLINHRFLSAEELASKLEEGGVLVRAGFHCAPLMHRYLGTEFSGGVRLSPGPFTTGEDIRKTLSLLDALQNKT